MTYQNPEVIEFVSKNVVPWRVSYLEDKKLVDQYRVEWTPCVMILDSEGAPHHGFTGFVAHQEFLAQLLFGVARIAYHSKKFTQSAQLFEKVSQQFPGTHAAPKAIWYHGIAEVQATGDKSGLKAIRLTLQEKYPHSIWAEKALPWGN